MSYENEIVAWLKDPVRKYADGITLLQRNHRNQILARTLAARESESNFKKLDYELQKLAESEPVMRQLEAQGFVAPANSTIIIMQTGAAPAPAADSPAADAPAEPLQLSPEVRARIDDLTIESSNLYKEQARISNTLADLGTDAERAEAVKQIEVVKAKRDQLAEERKTLEAGGELKSAEPSAPAAPTLAELEKKRDNLRTGVSKAKSAAEKAPTDAAKQTKFTMKRAELDELELLYKHTKEQNRLANA